mgnify:CR=1 FL=1
MIILNYPLDRKYKFDESKAVRTTIKKRTAVFSGGKVSHIEKEKEVLMIEDEFFYGSDKEYKEDLILSPEKYFKKAPQLPQTKRDLIKYIVSLITKFAKYKKNEKKNIHEFFKKYHGKIQRHV